MYDYYWARNYPSFNHNMMAIYYRFIIADMLQKFEKYRLPRSVYENLAWAGLGELTAGKKTIAWDNLSITEQNQIKSVWNQYFFNGAKTCL